MSDHDIDPKRLIRESYRIDGITAAQCRSIFLDWALSLPEGSDSAVAIGALLGRYGTVWPDHPMTQILEQGLTRIRAPRRRGGWRSRERGGNGSA